jgi:hypothetical protein
MKMIRQRKLLLNIRNCMLKRHTTLLKFFPLDGSPLPVIKCALPPNKLLIVGYPTIQSSNRWLTVSLTIKKYASMNLFYPIIFNSFDGKIVGKCQNYVNIGTPHHLAVTH